MTCATAWWRRKVNCPRVDSRAPRVWTDAPAARLRRAECSASETLYVPPPTRELTEEERIAQNMGEVLPTEAPQFIP